VAMSMMVMSAESGKFDRFMCFYLPVSLLAIRLPCFNKLELS